MTQKNTTQKTDYEIAEILKIGVSDLRRHGINYCEDDTCDICRDLAENKIL